MLIKATKTAATVCFLLSIIHGSFADTNTSNKVSSSHGTAMHGKLKYPESFSHFDYTSSAAIKGGTVRLGEMGTFNSLNPFIPKGTAASGIGMIYDTLTTASNDEAFSQYGLLAEKIEMPEDRSSVTFHLNPTAKFHDGHPLTADDVVFSFNLLVEKGSPFYSSYYAGVENVEALSPHKVHFRFKPGVNRELVMIVGQLPVLPRHFWKDRDFSKSDLTLPLGSGPYRIKSLDAGRTIVFERVDNYWGKDLAVNIGKNNFRLIQRDYYRDSVVLLEALKAGEIDYRYENSSKQWSIGYTGKAVDQGLLRKMNVAHQNNSGMQGFAFNLRRDLFKDIRVRKALALAFDFEWANKNLFYDAYKRTHSYFDNSELASSGLPTGRELEILTPFKSQLPGTVFEQAFELPVTDGSGNNRKQLRQAIKLLKEAGWQVKNNQLQHTTSGQIFQFEILLRQPSMERLVNPYAQNLKKLGIDVSVRVVDNSQYINRFRSFDFDMLVHGIGQSMSPGNEQLDFWGSTSADRKGGRNVFGVKDPVIDALIQLLIEAPNREELIVRTRALDRVLLHQYLIIPHFHASSHRIAYWDKFGRPEVAPPYDGNHFATFMTWWVAPDKEQALAKQKGRFKN